jgi:hypothetical protein
MLKEIASLKKDINWRGNKNDNIHINIIQDINIIY